MKYYSDHLIEENERLKEEVERRKEPIWWAESSFWLLPFGFLFGGCFFTITLGSNWWVGIFMMIYFTFCGYLFARIE